MRPQALVPDGLDDIPESPWNSIRPKDGRDNPGGTHPPFPPADPVANSFHDTPQNSGGAIMDVPKDTISIPTSIIAAV